MRIIDTTGTNMKVRSVVGTTRKMYSLDNGVTWHEASFNKCLQVLTALRNNGISVESGK